MSKKRYICDIHDEIMKISGLIEKNTCGRHINNMSEDDMRDMLDDINSRMSEIYSLSEEAKESGQHMEDRMNDYYGAICDLGFERKRK